MQPQNALVCALCNQKGGVGKTTSTINLAAAAVARMLRVLVVDLDPQGNTTTALALDDVAGTGAPGIAQALDPDDPAPVRDVIVPGLWEGCDLAPSPSTGRLADMETRIQAMRIGGEFQLRKALKEVAEDYDLVLIDNTPALGRLLINALAAAHRALIVTEAGRWAVDGLGELERTIEQVQEYNPALTTAGPLVNLRDRRYGTHSEVLGELVERYGLSPWTGQEVSGLTLSQGSNPVPLEEGAVIPKRTLVADFAAAGEPVSANRTRDGQAIALRYDWMLQQLMRGVAA